MAVDVRRIPSYSSLHPRGPRIQGNHVDLGNIRLDALEVLSQGPLNLIKKLSLRSRMNYFPLTVEQQKWKDLAAEIAERDIGPRAAGYDREAKFPRESLDSLKDAGLLGLRVSTEHGGLGADMVSICVVIEEISKKCASTAMCFKMHLEATEAVSQVHTPYQVERFVKPMANGQVFAAAAANESWGQSGNNWQGVSLFDVPAIGRVDGGFKLDNLRKSYVTAAGHATHYVIFSPLKAGGVPELLMIESDNIQWETVGEWNGLGMRGNSSVPMIFNGIIPEENLIGIGIQDEDEPLVLKHTMPVSSLTYGAAYLGIASGAYELACEEGNKRYPTGARRLDSPIHQRSMSELSVQIESARALLHLVASMADAGRATSLLPYYQARMACVELAIQVTQELMTMFGGTAYAGRLPFERYFRDARAGIVMPPSEQIYQRIGSLLFPEEVMTS